MKNKTILLNILLIFLWGCGSDNDDIYIISKPKPEPKPLKVIHHLSIKGWDNIDSNYNPIYSTNTFEFSYENGQVSKLTDIEKVGSYSDFEYDKEKKLIKILNYDNNILDSSVDFYYSGNLLSYTTTTEKGEITQNDKYNYTQNLLTSSETCSNPESCSGLNPITYTYYSTNNLESISDHNKKSVFLYDLKINPFKEYNPYFKIITNNYLYLTLSHNNPISENVYSNSSSVAYRTIIYTITYDNENYPLTVIGKDAVTDRLWVSYTFDYQTIMVDQEK